MMAAQRRCWSLCGRGVLHEQHHWEVGAVGATSLRSSPHAAGSEVLSSSFSTMGSPLCASTAQPRVPSPALCSCQPSNALPVPSDCRDICHYARPKETAREHPLPCKAQPKPQAVRSLVPRAHLTNWHHKEGPSMTNQPKKEAGRWTQKASPSKKAFASHCVLAVCCRDRRGGSHLPFLITSNHRVTSKLKCIPVAGVDGLLFI